MSSHNNNEDNLNEADKVLKGINKVIADVVGHVLPDGTVNSDTHSIFLMPLIRGYSGCRIPFFIYCPRKHYRQAYFVHSRLQDESLQAVTYLKQTT